MGQGARDREMTRALDSWSLQTTTQGQQLRTIGTATEGKAHVRESLEAHVGAGWGMEVRKGFCRQLGLDRTWQVGNGSRAQTEKDLAKTHGKRK